MDEIKRELGMKVDTDPADVWLGVFALREAVERVRAARAMAEAELLGARKSTEGLFCAKVKERLGLTDEDDGVLMCAGAMWVLDPYNAQLAVLGGAEVLAGSNPYGCNQHAHSWVERCPWDNPPEGEEWEPPKKKGKEPKPEPKPKGGTPDDKEAKKPKGEDAPEPEKKEERKQYFKPATKMSEAKKNTASLLGGDMKKVTWGKYMTVDQVNAFNEAMAEMMEKYPLKAEVVKMGSYTKHEWSGEGAHCKTICSFGGSNVKLEIEINQNKGKRGVHNFKNWKPYSKEHAEKTGYTRHNVGASEEGISIRAVMIHEYGHALHSRARMMARHGHMFKSTVAAEVMDNAPLWVSWENVFKQANTSGDIKKVSEYAATNASEFFAECFAARELGEKLPDYVNSALDNIIKLATKKA